MCVRPSKNIQGQTGLIIVEICTNPIEMAGNTKNVNDLTEQLRNHAHPCALREFEELTKFANAQGHEVKLKPWDTAFFGEIFDVWRCLGSCLGAVL